MIDMLTTNPLLAHALACYRQQDRPGLERAATLAYDVATRTGDDDAQAVAILLLGLARRDKQVVDSAARAFTYCHNWQGAGVALAFRAALERNPAKRLATLHTAGAHIETARQRLAQVGDIERWQRAGRIERVIIAAQQGESNDVQTGANSRNST